MNYEECWPSHKLAGRIMYSTVLYTEVTVHCKIFTVCTVYCI